MSFSNLENRFHLQSFTDAQSAHQCHPYTADDCEQCPSATAASTTPTAPAAYPDSAAGAEEEAQGEGEEKTGFGQYHEALR